MLVGALLPAGCGTGGDDAPTPGDDRRSAPDDRTAVEDREAMNDADSSDALVGISLAIDRTRYAPGQEIRMELRVFNRTDREITLEFRDGQRYDFVLEDEEGREVWRWSDDHHFIQVLGEETLGPEREELVYRERYEMDPPPGIYRLWAEVTSSSHPMSASLTLRIGQR